MNKINGPWFSKFDEDLATAFSIYCGISIAHVCAGGSSTLEGVTHEVGSQLRHSTEGWGWGDVCV